MLSSNWEARANQTANSSNSPVTSCKRSRRRRGGNRRKSGREMEGVGIDRSYCIASVSPVGGEEEEVER